MLLISTAIAIESKSIPKTKISCKTPVIHILPKPWLPASPDASMLHMLCCFASSRCFVQKSCTVIIDAVSAARLLEAPTSHPAARATGSSVVHSRHPLQYRLIAEHKLSEALYHAQSLLSEILHRPLDEVHVFIMHPASVQWHCAP